MNPTIAAKPGAEKWWHDWAWAGGVILLTLLVYWPTYSAGFIWNDSDYVTAAPLQSLKGLWQIWFKIGATQQYYPALHSAFWIEHQLWGDHALGYHLTNVLFHATGACLFALVLKRLRIRGAWLAAFIFALHPVYVESVAWITEEKNTLSTVGYLLSAWIFIGPDGEMAPGTGRRWLAFAVFFVAILSKSVAATLPAALLVVIWWKRDRINWRKEAVPLWAWFAAAIGIGLLTGWVEKKFIGAEGSDFAFNALERCLIAGHVVWFYFCKLFWPANLVFIYPRWIINPRDVWDYAYPAALVAALAALWWIRSWSRAPLAAALLFIGTLVPTIGFFNVYAFIFSFVADHWQYAAGFGFIALTAAVLAQGWDRIAPSLRRWAPLAAVPLVLALALKSREETHGYSDMGTFYRTIIERNPAAWMAHNNLGELLLHDGRVAESKQQFVTALEYRKDYPEAESNYGLAFMYEGNNREALKHLDLAEKLQPRVAIFHNNRGIALVAMKRYDEGAAEYTKALELSPGFQQPYYNRGLMWKTRGRADLAAEAFEQAYRLEPNYDTAIQLGPLLVQLGRLNDAVAVLRHASALQPSQAAPHWNIGNAYLAAGRLDLAMEECSKAVDLAPRDPVARYFLGLAYARSGRWEDALSQYHEALRLRPNYAEVENDLSMAYFNLKQLPEATAAAERAIKDLPAFPDAENNLGVYLAEQGRNADALPHLRRAAELNPSYYSAWDNLAKILLRLGRKQEAAEAAAHAAKLRGPAPAAPAPAGSKGH